MPVTETPLGSTAAPFHSQGYISRAIQMARTLADEPIGLGTRYSNTTLGNWLVTSLGDVWSSVRKAINFPPRSRYTFEIVAGRDQYLLPSGLAEFHRLSMINGQTGLTDWELIPQNPLSPCGPNFVLDGRRSIRFVPIPQERAVFTLEYVVGGELPLHQNITPLINPTTSLVQWDANGGVLNGSSTTWFLGQHDRREVSYVGSKLRVLGTTGDGGVTLSKTAVVTEKTSGSVGVLTLAAGHGLLVGSVINLKWATSTTRTACVITAVTNTTITLSGGTGTDLPAVDTTVLVQYSPGYFPIMERTISGFSHGGMRANVSMPFDYNFDFVDLRAENGDATPRTYVVYEVVPYLDPSILTLAAYRLACEIVTAGKKDAKINSLRMLYREKLTSVLNDLSDTDYRVGRHMNTDTIDQWSENYGPDGVFGL